jgi:hypothetical protein
MAISSKDFVLFLLKPNNGGSFHFSEYKTLDGQVHRLVETILPDGRTRYKRFHFNLDEPFTVHRSNKELLDFLENHPNNPESPWFNGKTLFYRLQPEVESQKRIEDKLFNAKVLTLASELKGKRLFEVASLCGLFFDESGGETLAFEAILSFAESRPQEFMKAYNVPNKEARMRHLVRTAIGKGVISNADGVYRFGSYTLGVDEESVIGKLTNEREVLEMIESRIGFIDTEKQEPQAQTKEPDHVDQPSVSMGDLNKYAKPKRQQQ